MSRLKNLELWIRGLIAALIGGAAGGIMNGLAAVGIDPQHFNFAAGMHGTLKMAGAGAAITGVIGVCAYLQKSPLPPLEVNGNDGNNNKAPSNP